MEKELRDKIKTKLTKFLNREPSEDEIINGQNDANLMGWIRDDEIKEQKVKIENLEKK